MSLRIAFFGTPSFACPSLAALALAHEVVAVVSQPAKPMGKHLALTDSAVAQVARDHQLPLFTPQKLREEPFYTEILKLEVEVAVVAAYGKILPQWLLDWPKHGMINIHGSLLPKYRGASPVTAALLAGDDETGITYIKMNAGMDEGEMLAAFSVAIDTVDTTQSLMDKLATTAATHIVEVVEGNMSGSLTPVAQDSTMATYTSLLKKEDGRIDFNTPPENLERIIRAYFPWPGVWGDFEGKRVKLLPGGLVQMEGKTPQILEQFRLVHPTFPLK